MTPDGLETIKISKRQIKSLPIKLIGQHEDSKNEHFNFSVMPHIIISPHIKGVMNFSTTVLPEPNTDQTTHSLILGCVSNISPLMTECVGPKTIKNVISFPSTMCVRWHMNISI